MADGGGSAESYIGSLISLTSKSEIRFEGRLYTVNTENSNIALQDVSSFGTEGRKKDGPQIPPSDKVYDYIIFRSSDIKDLQVKSSPQVVKTIAQPPPQPQNDPAIVSLQSGHPHPASLSSQFLQPPLRNSVGNNPSPYSNISVAAFHNSVPSIYRPAGLVSWGVPPPPGTNGNLAMPMYWQGHYRPPGGISPLQQQQHMLLQLPTLSTSQFSQSQLPQGSVHLGVSAVLPSSVSISAAQPLQNIPSMSFTDSCVTVSVSPNLSTVSLSLPIGSLTAASALALINPSPNTADSLPSSQGINAMINPSATILNPGVSSSQSTASPSGQITCGVSAALLKPAQLFHPGTLSMMPKNSTAADKPLVSDHNMPELSNIAASTTPMLSVPQPWGSTAQPLLPLPTASSVQNQYSQANKFLGNTKMWRGRGRGRGRGSGYWILHPAHQFTEDFDFTAMNEKFNKDEVWGELGKGECIGVDGEQVGVEDGHEDDESNDGQPNGTLDMPRKFVYAKDDFFDSISCDAVDRVRQTEKSKFSEQRKIDTATFGRFSLRTRSGCRGRNGSLQGGFRAVYCGNEKTDRGRGNGHGRGRGVARIAATN